MSSQKPSKTIPTPDSAGPGSSRGFFGSSLFEPMKPLPGRHFKLGPHWQRTV